MLRLEQLWRQWCREPRSLRDTCDYCGNWVNFCVHQGDDLRVLVEVVDQDDEDMSVQDVQEITWALAKNVDQPILVEKKFTEGQVHLGGPSIFYFDIEPDDTDGLEPGYYYHEAEVVTYQGRRYTVMVGIVKIDPQLIKEQE